MPTHHIPLHLMLAGALALALCLTGCIPATSGDTGSETSGSDVAGETSGGDTDGTGDGSGAGSADTSTTEAYTPGEELEVSSGSVSIIIPAESCDEAFTLSVQAMTGSDVEADAPGEPNLAGGVFGPDDQAFSPPARVTVQLSEETFLTTLPVLTLNDAGTEWVGAGVNATVSDGTEAMFLVSHFSTYAVPDPIPVPTAGDAVGSFVVISNDGNFSSNVISGDTASLTYSEFGDTFGLSVTSQEVGDSGELETSSLGLNAQTVSSAGNYVVGVCAGGRSIYNDGNYNESCYGVMIMSVSGSSVTVTVYVATPKRVIYGTLSGESL